MLRQCHSATTTRGGARALAQVFTPGYFSLHEEGLAVLAGGFLPAVLKTAIGLSRISNPRPSPQLSFWGLPQKLGAQKVMSLPPSLPSPLTQFVGAASPSSPNASLRVGLSRCPLPLGTPPWHSPHEDLTTRGPFGWRRGPNHIPTPPAPTSHRHGDTGSTALSPVQQWHLGTTRHKGTERTMQRFHHPALCPHSLFPSPRVWDTPDVPTALCPIPGSPSVCSHALLRHGKVSCSALFPPTLPQISATPWSDPSSRTGRWVGPPSTPWTPARCDEFARSQLAAHPNAGAKGRRSAPHCSLWGTQGRGRRGREALTARWPSLVPTPS